jgi:hypothetical protein
MAMDLRSGTRGGRRQDEDAVIYRSHFGIDEPKGEMAACPVQVIGGSGNVVVLVPITAEGILLTARLRASQTALHLQAVLRTSRPSVCAGQLT